MSYRAQCNLHLHYAQKHLGLLENNEDDWGGHLLPAVGVSSLFHLILSYRFHLRDVVNKYSPSENTFEHAASAQAFLQSRQHISPELTELEYKEQTAWLGDMLNYPFMDAAQQSSSGGLAMDVLAADSPKNTLSYSFIKQCSQGLDELVKRQREGMQEW